jgi:CubicO group peptidase (beta-lactamase class C family)
METGDLEALLNQSPVTGLAVAVIEHNSTRIAYMGELEGVSLSSETIWPVASLTKPVFAYGVLQLAQAGLLDLDRPLATYLDEPYATGDAFALMTARQALSHTTGLPNWRGTHGLQADSPPGARFSYSAEGLHYLQHVVERVVGRPIEDLLHEHLFEPLGMTHSVLVPETKETISPNLEFLLTALPVSGALSLRTTIGDYARFMHTMCAGSERVPGLLNTHWRSTMLTPQATVGGRPGLFWGLGWGLQGTAEEQSFWHWGARGIPRTMSFAVGWPPLGTAVVIFTNHAEGLSLCRDIIKTAYPGVALPAFDWLLPSQYWRPDGSLG